MKGFLLNSYYKITNTIQSSTTPEHANVANNMLCNLKQWVEMQEYNMRINIFGWKIWKWRNNYIEYNKFTTFAVLVIEDIEQLLNEWVKKYNEAVEEAQREYESQAQEDQFKVAVVKGFQSDPNEGEEESCEEEHGYC